MNYFYQGKRDKSHVELIRISFENELKKERVYEILNWKLNKKHEIKVNTKIGDLHLKMPIFIYLGSYEHHLSNK